MKPATFKDTARHEWDKARKKVFWSKLRSSVTNPPRPLVCFDDTVRFFQLRTPLYRGVQTIPVDRIVGSVGRYQDFFQAFLPANEALKPRWETVAGLYLDPDYAGMPPIDVFQVGDAYFVKDGNHRVSVANQLGLADIEAYVWQYPQPVIGLGETGDLDTALLETERHTFLTQTHLIDIVADEDLHFTINGGFEIVRGQIVYYQYVLSEIDGQEIDYEEAAQAWYQLIYQPLIQAIDGAGLSVLWPEFTSADLYIWLIQHQHALEDQSQTQVLMTEAATELEREHRPHLPRCLWGLHHACLKRLGKRQPPEIIDPEFSGRLTAF